jgi:hypothetical protein
MIAQLDFNRACIAVHNLVYKQGDVGGLLRRWKWTSFGVRCNNDVSREEPQRK